MKKFGLTCVCLVVSSSWACGGTGSTDIDGGGSDGSTNDVVTSNDGSPQDSSTNDATSSDATTNDAGNFNVANVNGLVLWLKGDLSSSLTTITPDGGSPSVTIWADQTSHHNDAKGNGNNLPRNPTVKPSAINGLSAVHFNKQPNPQANQGQMLNVVNNTDNSLQWGTGDFYIAVVGDFDNNPADGPNLGVGNFYSKATFNVASITGPSFYANVPAPPNGNPSTGLFFSTALANGDSITTATAYNNSAPHLFAVRRQSGKLDIFVDGTSVASATPNSAVDQNDSNGARIGADGDANLVRLDGDIGEMIAVKDVLSSSDQLGIEGYLKAKWGTP